MKELILYKTYLFSEIEDWCSNNKDDYNDIGEEFTVGLTFLTTQCSVDNKTYSFVLTGYLPDKGPIYRLIFKD